MCDKQLTTNHDHTTFEGKINKYAPLERIVGQVYTYSADIWSMGMVVYKMYTGNILLRPPETSL